jgi:hypothetical protein
MDQGACEVRKLVTFDSLVSEQVHQLDRLRNLMGRLRTIRESVNGPVPEDPQAGCGDEKKAAGCFLDRSMELNSNICNELREIEGEVALLESICGCGNPKTPIDDLGARKARGLIRG